MSQPSRSFAVGPLVLAGMILVAALTRVLPHAWNFSPVEAIALFGGAFFSRRSWALAVPIAAMLISDLALALIHGGVYADYVFKAGFLPIYLSILLCTVLGFALRGRVNGATVLGASLAGSVVFFLVTNFAVWLTARPEIVSECSRGLAACYIAGLPFFKWTVEGSLFYSALLFGSFALLRSRIPQLRAQTA